MITPPAQPDATHCRHRAHRRHHHHHHHHHAPAHITSRPERQRGKERGCDQTQISQLSNAHTFLSAPERVRMNFGSALIVISTGTQALGKCSICLIALKFSNQIWKLEIIRFCEFSQACACTTSTTLTTVSKRAVDVCKRPPAHSDPSLCFSSPVEQYANNVYLLVAMTTTTIATEAVLQESITPTVFLLGFYREPALFKGSCLGEKVKAMRYKEGRRSSASGENL